jgi:hypothetical protein
MYVAVQHTISDPPAFWAKAGEIVPHLPDHVKLHQCFPTRDGSRGICIWEGKSVNAVRSYVEGQVGKVSSTQSRSPLVSPLLDTGFASTTGSRSRVTRAG